MRFRLPICHESAPQARMSLMYKEQGAPAASNISYNLGLEAQVDYIAPPVRPLSQR